MNKNILKLSVFLFFNLSIVFSQEACETNEDTLEDLNSITKCTIDKTEKTSSSGKKTKKLSVKVSTSTRYLKRRIKKEVAKKEIVKKEVATGIAGMQTAGIQNAEVVNTNHDTAMNKSLSLKESSIDNIQKFKERLSKDQLKNAYEFENLDQIPLFKSCQNKTKSKNESCFNEKMMAHIQEHFRYPQEALLNKTQGNVWVRFIIDEDGNITNLKSLGPKNGNVLKHEAERVISKLPSFQPAVKDGKKVLSKYGFPINFSLED